MHRRVGGGGGWMSALADHYSGKRQHMVKKLKYFLCWGFFLARCYVSYLFTLFMPLKKEIE